MTGVEEVLGCPRCVAYYVSEPHLHGACASVGIEYGKSTDEMLRDYMIGFHRSGHQHDVRPSDAPRG